MAVVFEAAGPAATGSAVTNATVSFPGTPSGQMLLAVFAFENVAAGSGPWISSSVGGGWSRTFYQEPVAGNGVGIEVWNTLDWSTSPTDQFNFFGAQAYVGQGLVYTGQFFDGSTSPVRTVVQQAVSGSSPSTPTVTAFTGELLLAVAGDTLAAPGFGTPNPAGSQARFDSARSGFGTAEVTAADLQVAAGGTLGPFTWPATASPGGARGATAVIAIRPAVSGGTSPSVIDVPLPPDILLAGGYTIRISATDPLTGAVVSGVKVSDLAMMVETGGNTAPGDLAVGPFQLVPGPGA